MKTRILMTTIIAGALLAGCCDKSGKTAAADGSCDKKHDIASITFDNSYYYKDGVFQEDKAKDAVIALMEYYDYPIFPNVRNLLWVSDYGTGQYAKVGLACIGFVNNEQDLYMLQDLYMMPGQMLPEHWHEKPADLPIKMEAWTIRNGTSYIVGIGEDNLSKFPYVQVPDAHMGGKVTVMNVIEATPGMTVLLKEAGSRHWQFAGPEGVIMSEVANVHSNADVRHSDPGINDHFLGK